MNDLIYDNSNIFYYLIKNNRNLRELGYKDNKLLLNNKSINTKNINIKELIKPYSKLELDLKLDNITSDNFFDIILINTIKIEPNITVSNSLTDYALNFLDNTKYDVININHFKKLLDNFHNLNEQDYKDFINFISYAKLLLIQDNPNETYLNDEQLNTLNEFKNIMNNINDNTIQNIYNNIIKTCDNERTRRENKKLKLEKKDGYANAFLVIGIIVLTGIVMGTIGYFFL